MDPRLFAAFDPESGAIDGCPVVRRHLSDLPGVFADEDAYRTLVESGNPLLYTVSTFDMPEGEGALHCGLGVIFPGMVGDEYFMTRGHLHARRVAAEFYIGLRGRGLMLLQKEDGTREQAVELLPQGLVYVPGGTAHRTVNTGSEPLAYLGVYPATAGHDYASIGSFLSVVVARDGRPAVIPRKAWKIQKHGRS
jgi:glucose-6-phosphate isomerase, archaeal